jgi:predicted DNA-binding transcriptional regulator YafY
VRASRLVNLLLLLQTRGGQTAAELARELEVSVRTVHRDVEALSAAGVPIYADRGPHGGIRLVDGYRTRLTGMTADEAEALFLSGLPGPAAELGLGTVVTAARLKVLAALPTELRSRASRLVERFHLDAAGWFQANEPVPLLSVVAEAVWEGRVVRIDYHRGDGVAVRDVSPLGLVIKAGVWYLVAIADGQIRTYRVSRIADAEVLEERVERPRDFDLAAYWAESSAAYERNSERVKVDVRLRAERLERLMSAVGAGVVERAEHLDEADPDFVRLRLEMMWPDEVPGRMLAAGSSVEVLAPAEIRERVIASARRIIDLYGREGPETLPAGVHGTDRGTGGTLPGETRPTVGDVRSEAVVRSPASATGS